MYRGYKESNIIKTIKINRLRWMGHIMRMPETDPARKILLKKPMGHRRGGRPRLQSLDCVESGPREIGMRGWEDGRWMGTK